MSYWPAANYPLNSYDRTWYPGVIPDNTRRLEDTPLAGQGYAGPSRFSGGGGGGGGSSMDVRELFNLRYDRCMAPIGTAAGVLHTWVHGKGVADRTLSDVIICIDGAFLASTWGSPAFSEPNTPAVQAVVTTFPIRKYLSDELLGSKNGMKLIRN
jgi:hypothetical protein